ncbi:hypothetical protein ACS0TY_004356 [Phlomoides rotata]
MQSLSTGRCWSGQLCLRKRSGQSFMALVTKSPLYEDGELTGIVTVSSDAAVFNNTNPGIMMRNRDNAYEQSKFSKISFRRVQWHPQPQITEVPQIASSVSNLASKVLLRKRGDVTGDTLRTRECEEVEVESHDAKANRPPKVPITKSAFSMSIGGSRTEAMSLEKEESVSGFTQSSKTGVKFFQKLRIGVISNLEKVVDENMHQNSSEDTSLRKETANVAYSLKGVPVCTCEGCCEVHRPAGQLSRSSLQSDGSKFVANVLNMKSVNSEDASPRQSGYHKIQSSEDCFGGLGSLSSKGDYDSLMNSEIRWDDLQLREEIGQGSFAVVYHGLWNGSDVAVKVYSGNQYSEETLLDSKKGIDIMRRLRHPNVLLFMGAVISEGRIAMVTEYMTRGSLFKVLHRSNQSLDIRRRLQMAVDVARGMNYLHCRNPPVVHRDLKSSNLLVDKSWNVKVGDFGLSKLKYATFLTAKSGRGTPQWMAPEVLRNELSTEKSDVFSFGVILWELVTESIPWSDLNSLQVVGVVGFMDRRLDLPDNIDPQVSSIISECWQSNPEDRPSFEHIIHMMTHLVHAGVE